MNQVLIILKETTRQKPPIRPCFVFSTGLAGFLFLSIVGISYLEALFNLSRSFFLVYGVEAMVIIEMMVPPAQLALLKNSIIPMIEFITWRLLSKWDIMQKTSGRPKNRSARFTIKWSDPCVCSLVLKTARHILKWLSASKYTPKWEWPYDISKALVATSLSSSLMTYYLKLTVKLELYFLRAKWEKNFV